MNCILYNGKNSQPFSGRVRKPRGMRRARNLLFKKKRRVGYERDRQRNGYFQKNGSKTIEAGKQFH